MRWQYAHCLRSVAVRSIGAAGDREVPTREPSPTGSLLRGRRVHHLALGARILLAHGEEENPADLGAERIHETRGQLGAPSGVERAGERAVLDALKAVVLAGVRHAPADGVVHDV